MAPLIEALVGKLDALNDLVAAEKRRHVLQLAQLHAEAAATKVALVRARKDAHRDLSPHHETGTMGHPMADKRLPRPRAPRLRRSDLPTDRPWNGRVTTSAHAFPLKLLAQDPPVNIKQWAKNHGLDRERVRGWYAEPGSKGARKIPKMWAAVIELELGLPANEITWPNGIDPNDDTTAAPYLPDAP